MRRARALAPAPPAEGPGAALATGPHVGSSGARRDGRRPGIAMEIGPCEAGRESDVRGMRNVAVEFRIADDVEHRNSFQMTAASEPEHPILPPPAGGGDAPRTAHP